ncbi:hypothetical protein [Roseobacter sp. HKCCA0434]|uniref:hypothetical protein n=1 Tax=Roseobacter sp. HKCCA0434 TaxID=3079297 RepID=UPI002905B597|nr:hypothetical protein [Roseobacter sp. HKCCA0434]
MIRALAALLLLAACTAAPATGPRRALLAEDVAVFIRVDATQGEAFADTVAAETARLIGPPFELTRMSGRELILNMTGRAGRGEDAGRPTLYMDWDVREPGGTQVALFRVATLARPGVGTISRRDADGLAFYSAEALIQQPGIRAIVLQRRN